MKQLAILVDNLGYSQKSKKICDALAKISNEYNPVVFVAEYSPLPVPTTFPIMELVKAYDYEATFISTDFYTTQIMNNCLRPIKKYFYVWDLEYLYSGFNFSILNQMYNNPTVDLIARNKYRFDILKNTWKQPKFIMEEFDHKILEELL